MGTPVKYIEVHLTQMHQESECIEADGGGACGGDHARAEDATNEAFVSALERWDAVSKMESPRGGPSVLLSQDAPDLSSSSSAKRTRGSLCLPSSSGTVAGVLQRTPPPGLGLSQVKEPQMPPRHSGLLYRLRGCHINCRDQLRLIRLMIRTTPRLHYRGPSQFDSPSFGIGASGADQSLNPTIGRSQHLSRPSQTPPSICPHFRSMRSEIRSLGALIWPTFGRALVVISASAAVGDGPWTLRCRCLLWCCCQ